MTSRGAKRSGDPPSSSPTSKGRGNSDRGNEASDIPVGKIFIVVLTLAALLVGVYIQVAKNLSESLSKKWALSSYSSDTRSSFTGDESMSDGHQRIYQGYKTLVVADNMDAGYLDHIIDALLKFSHKLSFSGSLTKQKASLEENLGQFDLIWTHDYPFVTIKKLHPHQRINHFPGTGFITNKLTLSTTPRLPHVLRAFRLPQERDKFVEFAEAKQKRAATHKVQWIRKSSGHRGISIETMESILAQLNQEPEPAGVNSPNTEDVLVQEYMSNPLLIDGKKFDIGIYAVLTSVEPLRAYIYESEALLRFCAHPYLNPSTKHFNISDLDSYVVGDDYTPIWLMPSLLRHYIGTNLSMKQTLNTYLSKQNKSGEQIWAQIEETIMAVYKSKEHHLARMSRMYQESNNYNGTSLEGSLGQFFEMVRFDFIVDDQLNVYLMEANMSPNLSSRHFPPNRLLYEQVLASYFSLAGLDQFSRHQLTGSQLPIAYLDGRYEVPGKMNKPGGGVESSRRYGLDELISEKELSVYEDLCVSDECHMNCAKLECKICYFCLSYSDKLHLKRAIYEQLNRWNFKRIFPSTRDQDLKFQLSHPDKLIHQKQTAEQEDVNANYIHVQWFRGKCFTDKRFCTY